MWLLSLSRKWKSPNIKYSFDLDKIVLQTSLFFNYPSTNTNPCLLEGSKRMLFLSQKMGDWTSIHHNQRLFAKTVTVTKAQFNSYQQCQRQSTTSKKYYYSPRALELPMILTLETIMCCSCQIDND